MGQSLGWTPCTQPELVPLMVLVSKSLTCAAPPAGFLCCPIVLCTFRNKAYTDNAHPAPAVYHASPKGQPQPQFQCANLTWAKSISIKPFQS